MKKLAMTTLCFATAVSNTAGAAPQVFEVPLGTPYWELLPLPFPTEWLPPFVLRYDNELMLNVQPGTWASGFAAVRNSAIQVPGEPSLDTMTLYDTPNGCSGLSWLPAEYSNGTLTFNALTAHPTHGRFRAHAMSAELSNKFADRSSTQERLLWSFRVKGRTQTFRPMSFAIFPSSGEGEPLATISLAWHYVLLSTRGDGRTELFPWMDTVELWVRVSLAPQDGYDSVFVSLDRVTVEPSPDPSDDWRDVSMMADLGSARWWERPQIRVRTEGSPSVCFGTSVELMEMTLSARGY